MSFTPQEEADILLMRAAFMNGSTTAGLTLATSIDETELVEIIQLGSSKKAPVSLLGSRRMEYAENYGFLPTNTATANVSALYYRYFLKEMMIYPLGSYYYWQNPAELR